MADVGFLRSADSLWERMDPMFLLMHEAGSTELVPLRHRLTPPVGPYLPRTRPLSWKGPNALRPPPLRDLGDRDGRYPPALRRHRTPPPFTYLANPPALAADWDTHSKQLPGSDMITMARSLHYTRGCTRVIAYKDIMVPFIQNHNTVRHNMPYGKLLIQILRSSGTGARCTTGTTPHSATPPPSPGD